MATNFKQRTPRDKKYLKWILTQQCVLRDCHCFGQIVYHHSSSGGVSLKGSDLEAIPVCMKHHSDLHNCYGKGGAWTKDELAAIIKRLREEYKSKGGV